MGARGGGIFISYRRGDSQFAAGRLADALVREFGDARVFRDIDDIRAGADFVDALDHALGACSVMLVLIGNQWLDMRDAHGQRRIDAAGDWVRLEIARALQGGIRVVPVLLERTEMPVEESLPEDLKPLSRRQAIQLVDAHWSRDVASLVAAVRPDLGPTAATAAPPSLQDTAKGVGTRLEAGVRTGLTWARRAVLAVGGLVLLLLFLAVRSCNDEPPDLAGRWKSAEGWTMDFQPRQGEGKRAYRVLGRTSPTTALECDAVPGYFGSAELACALTEGGSPADRFKCTGLYISGSPLTINGDCKWDRDGSTRKLSLAR